VGGNHGRNFLFAIAATIALFLSQPPGPAHAQAFRTIRPARSRSSSALPPGGGVDTMARIVAQGTDGAVWLSDRGREQARCGFQQSPAKAVAKRGAGRLHVPCSPATVWRSIRRFYKEISTIRFDELRPVGDCGN